MSIGTNVKEFRPPRSTRIAMSLVFAFPVILMIVMGYVLNDSVTNANDRYIMNIAILVMSVIAGLFGLYIWGLNTKKVTVDSCEFSYTSVFKKKIVSLSDIEGFRLNRSGLKATFYPKKETGKSVIVTFFNAELNKWAAANYPNLDQVAFEKEKNAILADENFGATLEERSQNLKKTELVDSSIAALGFLITIFTLWFKLPYLLNFYFVVIATLWVFYALISYKGLIRMEWRTAHTSMWLPVVMIGMATFSGFSRVESIAHFTLLPLAILATVIVTALYVFLIVGTAKYKFKKIGMSLFLFLVLLYSFASALNIVLDFAAPTSHTTQIVDTVRTKSISARYGTTSYSYDMHLAPWNTENKKNIVVGISRQNHQNLKRGTTIEIRQHKGFFGNAWFTAHFNGEELMEFDTDFAIFNKE